MRIPAQKIRMHPDDEEWIMEKLHEIMYETGQMAQDKYIKEFEERWAKECNTKHCVTMNSCTSALEVALYPLVTSTTGRKIIVPTNTYGATAQAVWNADMVVELVDIEEDLMMDIDKINWEDEELGAIIFVSIGGNIPPKLEKLDRLCKSHGIPLILDVAHAHGVEEATKWGDAQCFSFFATKLISTLGEGGALVTNNKDVATFARMYRHHGRYDRGMNWEHMSDGANLKMTEAQAIVGLAEMTHLHEYIRNRKDIAEIYMEKFKPVVYAWTNYYKYIVRGRPKIKSKDITLSSPVYSKPIHKHPMWQCLGNTNEYPVADCVCPNHFCLPIYNRQSYEEAEYVLKNIKI